MTTTGQEPVVKTKVMQEEQVEELEDIQAPPKSVMEQPHQRRRLWDYNADNVGLVDDGGGGGKPRAKILREKGGVEENVDATMDDRVTYCAATSANTVNGDFRVQVRLEASDEKPIRQFQIKELPELTFKALVEKIVTLSSSSSSSLPNTSCPSNYIITNTSIKYSIGKHSDWWIELTNTIDLLDALSDCHRAGLAVLYLSASPISINNATTPVAAATTTTTNIPKNKIKTKSCMSPARSITSDGSNSSTTTTTTIGRRSLPIAINKKRVIVIKKTKKSTSKHAAPGKSTTTSATTTTTGNDKRSVTEKVLASLAEFRAINIFEPTLEQVAALAGYKSVETKSFRSCIVALKTNGMILTTRRSLARDNNKGSSGNSVAVVQLTNAGIAAAGPAANAPKTNAEFHARLSMTLFNNQRVASKIFEILGKDGAKEILALAKELGYSSLETKSFREALSTMKKHCLLEYSTDGNKTKWIQLTDSAFPYGRNTSTTSIASTAVLPIAVASSDSMVTEVESC